MFIHPVGVGIYDAYINLGARPYLEYNFDIYESVLNLYSEANPNWLSKDEKIDISNLLFCLIESGEETERVSVEWEDFTVLGKDMEFFMEGNQSKVSLQTTNFLWKY